MRSPVYHGMRALARSLAGLYLCIVEEAPQLAQSVVVKCIVFGYSPLHSLLFSILWLSLAVGEAGSVRTHECARKRSAKLRPAAESKERSTRIILEFTRGNMRSLGL